MNQVDIATAAGPFFYLILLSMLFPVFVNLIVYEKENRLTVLMKMNGLRMSLWWAVNYVFCFALYLAVMIFFLIAYVVSAVDHGKVDTAIQWRCTSLPVLHAELARCSRGAPHPMGLRQRLVLLRCLHPLQQGACSDNHLLLLDHPHRADRQLSHRQLGARHRGQAGARQRRLARARVGALPSDGLHSHADPESGYAFFKSNTHTHIHTHIPPHDKALTSLAGPGVSWSDVSDSKMNIAACYGYLILAGILWFLLALYLEEVLPQEFGVQRHPLFFLKRAYWFGDDDNAGTLSLLVTPCLSLLPELVLSLSIRFFSSTVTHNVIPNQYLALRMSQCRQIRPLWRRSASAPSTANSRLPYVCLASARSTAQRYWQDTRIIFSLLYTVFHRALYPFHRLRSRMWLSALSPAYASVC